MTLLRGGEILHEFLSGGLILALNTEKAHNLREKSIETIRMARALADAGNQAEASYAFEFEQPSFLTLGIGYESRRA